MLLPQQLCQLEEAILHSAICRKHALEVLLLGLDALAEQQLAGLAVAGESSDVEGRVPVAIPCVLIVSVCVQEGEERRRRGRKSLILNRRRKVLTGHAEKFQRQEAS
eukprot:749269-Hanusia_phi.AAC.1